MRGRAHRLAGLVAWVSLVAFAALSAASAAGVLSAVDARILGLVQKIHTSPALDAVGGYFSTLGEVQYVGAAVLLLAALLTITDRRALGLRLIAAFALTGVVELAMKFYLPADPMPPETMRSFDATPILEVSHPYPYPSGHVLRAVVLLGTVCVLWPSRPVWLGTLSLLFGMVATRVYLGVHWASDALGGALLGIAGVAWVARAGKSRP